MRGTPEHTPLSRESVLGFCNRVDQGAGPPGPSRLTSTLRVGLVFCERRLPPDVLRQYRGPPARCCLIGTVIPDRKFVRMVQIEDRRFRGGRAAFETIEERTHRLGGRFVGAVETPDRIEPYQAPPGRPAFPLVDGRAVRDSVVVNQLYVGRGTDQRDDPDALRDCVPFWSREMGAERVESMRDDFGGDRKSTRLNSSHHSISYAVFCLK